eukprot:scaffold28555_cov58-Phaeocystis_antarctica.AAC.2
MGASQAALPLSAELDGGPGGNEHGGEGPASLEPVSPSCGGCATAPWPGAGALKRQLAGRVGGHHRRHGESEEQHAHEAHAVGGRRAKAEALPGGTALSPIESVQEPEPEEEDCRGDANPDRVFTLGSTRLRPTVEGCKQRK